jgi:hypothetical protein
MATRCRAHWQTSPIPVARMLVTTTIRQDDHGCLDFLNQLLASAEPRVALVSGQKMVAGHWVSEDIFDALDVMSGASFKETGESGVRQDSSLETINDLRTVPGSRNVEVNNSYISQTAEDRMFAVIHESLHMYAGFTDQVLAAAIGGLIPVFISPIS